MTVACILCGFLIETPPDAILDAARTQREMTLVLNALMKHFQTSHGKLGVELWQVSSSLLSLELFAHCSSGDARFNEFVAGLHAELKKHVNAITPGVVAAAPVAAGPKVVV